MKTKEKTKIHPHLKSFIHSVVMAEMTSTGAPGKTEKWKEALMRQVQSTILERVEEIHSQADLERVTLEEARKLNNDFTLTLGLVQHTLSQVPVDVLRQSVSRR